MPPIRAHKHRDTFLLSYTVTTPIQASPERIWSHLTDGAKFTEWNSTVTSLEGEIAKGNTIHLKAKIAPENTFSLNVAEFKPQRRMVWRSGIYPIFRGIRTYSLTQEGEHIQFTMQEEFSGLVLPLMHKSLPDLSESFVQFASDLKAVSEK